MTRRNLLAVVAFAALAAWVSAQGPTNGLTAGQQLGLLKSNRPLLDDLTRSGLALGTRDTPLDRADECGKVATRLAREVRTAVDRKDADRLAEVSDHLKAVASDGLAPNLREARRGITPQSEGFKRLQTVHEEAFTNLSAAADAIPADGDLGKSQRAQAARTALSAAAAAVGPFEK